MDYDRVESLQNKYGITDVKMAEIIGVSRSQSYRDMINAKRMKVVYLEKICEYFKVNVTEFIKPVRSEKLTSEDLEALQEPPPIYNTKPCPTCEAKNEMIEILKESNKQLNERIKHMEKIMDSYLRPQGRATGT